MNKSFLRQAWDVTKPNIAPIGTSVAFGSILYAMDPKLLVATAAFAAVTTALTYKVAKPQP